MNHAHIKRLISSAPHQETGAIYFLNKKRDGPLTLQTLAVRMAVWGREANLRLHPHRCRHTHATHAIRLGVDLFTLSARLGHSST